MDRLVEVRNLTKNYGDLIAIEDLSFWVGEGEILGLVGPNGAGKTTTLRALAGIHRPTRGEITICGADVVDQPVAAKQHLAFFSDEPKLFDYLTVEEHLQFVAKIYGVNEWKPQAEALLEELELTPKRKALPAELSRGMKQKLMIACGLVHDPRVLIFDEPLTGLDPLGIRKMKATIRRRKENGAAILISSHLLHLVEELCDTLLIVHRGRSIAFGTLDQIRRISAATSDTTLEEAFIRITASEPPEVGATR
ncbi:MAG: ABC transporter ATP-binding protein [Thermoanaerobaculia bacterium]